MGVPFEPLKFAFEYYKDDNVFGLQWVLTKPSVHLLWARNINDKNSFGTKFNGNLLELASASDFDGIQYDTFASFKRNQSKGLYLN